MRIGEAGDTTIHGYNGKQVRDVIPIVATSFVHSKRSS